MAITTPFGLELARDEDAKDAVEGDTNVLVALKIKIFLGANVNPALIQTYVGSLRACYRHLMNEALKKGISSATVGRGDWRAASAGNISIDSGTAFITDDDVAVIVSGTLTPVGGTHFQTETFNQLINGLLERTKDN